MKKIAAYLICLLGIFRATNAAAQTEQEKLIVTILHLDSSFWKAYNNCDTAAFKNFFTDDVEFYHDKGGTTTGSPALIEVMDKNLCGNNNFRLRREALKGTVKVYPMQNGNEIYGAIISGEHLFYITADGKPEYLDGQALFTHVWLLKDGAWKMSRILSFNHHPAEYINTKKEIELSPEKLDVLIGSYKNNQSDIINVERKNNLLILTVDKESFTLYPQSETMFFTKDRDLVFEFIKSNNKPSKLIVREHGVVADEAVFQK